MFLKNSPAERINNRRIVKSYLFSAQNLFGEKMRLSPLKNRDLISAIKIFVKHNKTFDKNKKNIYNNLAS